MVTPPEGVTWTERRQEVRIVGEPGFPFPPYDVTFPHLESARQFIGIVTNADHVTWRTPPKILTRWVITSDWAQDESPTLGGPALGKEET